MFRTLLLAAVIATVGWSVRPALGEPAPAGPNEVYQGLDEVTARIARLKTKPLDRLLGPDSASQPEVLIFRDSETGAEIWSLTRELCKDLANIERRCPWNCDGSVISLKGNRAFRDPSGKISTSTWDGFSYLMSADGGVSIKFFATNPDGSLVELNDKFNNWDRKEPAYLYFPALKVGNGYRAWSMDGPKDAEMWLVRVRVSKDFRRNTIEPLCRFPNNRRKLTQNISDDNKLCIQDVNGASMQEMPSFYVVDLNKRPGEPGFLQSHPMAYGIKDVPGHDPNNEYHVHGITISRDGKRVSWNYGPMTDVGEPIGFSVPADNLNAAPTCQMQAKDEWGQYLSHPDEWRDGRCAYFSGPTDQLKAAGIAGGWGIWTRVPGRKPAYTGVGASGGHITWCGGDPDWFFANVSRPDKGWDTPVKGRIVAGKADGSVLKVLCNPYDRLRGGKAGYDGIPRAIQSPDATKCWFHSSMLMPGDEFTGSFIAVFRRPYPPTELTARPAGRRIALSWKAHPVSAEVKGYHVYQRGPGAGAPWVELTATAVAGSQYLAPLPSRPGAYSFAVTAEEYSRLESDVTSPVANVTVAGGKATPAGAGEPVRGWDRTAPAAPKGFTATKDPAGVLLRWAPSPETDLRYYNIYFSAAGRPEPVQARRIVSPPHDCTQYLDWTAPEGAGHYALTAVDRHGNESAPAFADVGGR